MDTLLFISSLTLWLFSEASSKVVAKGVWFQEITGNVDRHQQGHSTTTSFFSKNFHKCNLNKHCKFVLKNLKTNEHNEVASENDLPQNRDGYQIWKKKEEKGKVIPRVLGKRKPPICNLTFRDFLDTILCKISYLVGKILKICKKWRQRNKTLNQSLFL